MYACMMYICSFAFPLNFVALKEISSGSGDTSAFCGMKRINFI